MTHQQIQVGRTYRLKSTRQQAYGLPGRGEYLITDITYRPGYKVPHVWSGTYAFRPADFSCEVFA